MICVVGATAHSLLRLQNSSLQNAPEFCYVFDICGLLVHFTVYASQKQLRYTL